MITSHRTETEIRRFDSAGSNEPRTETETRFVFQGSGRLSICAGAIEFSDRYGVDDRKCLALWFDGDEVPAAIVDWLASLHAGATTERNDTLRQSCTEKLRRFAGAMGLAYQATPAFAAATVDGGN